MRDLLSLQKYFKEVTVWKRLKHPNILPNLGAGPDIAEFCVVSPWMSDGDLLQFLAKYPGANRVAIVSVHAVYRGQHAESVPKMIGVADGLSYLHSCDVIHGDLKGVNHIRRTGSILLMLIRQMNILFDSTGVPQITDFALASIDCNPNTNVASTPTYGYSLRWAAPEMLEARNEDRRATKMSDVYAFAMVVIEVKYDHHFRWPNF